MDRTKEEMTLEDIVNYKPVRVNPVKTMRVFLDNGDKRLYNMLKEQFERGIEIHELIKKEHLDLLNNPDNYGKYFTVFKNTVGVKDLGWDRETIRAMAVTIHWFGKKIKNIKQWYCIIELLNVDKVKDIPAPITHFNAIRIRKGIVSEFYKDRELTTLTKVNVQQRLIKTTVLLQHGLVAVDMFLYKGSYKKGTVILVNNKNSMFRILKNITNIAFIYGNLLLEKLRGTKPSQIYRHGGHKGLYNRLYGLFLDRNTGPISETVKGILQRVASDIFKEIVKTRKRPKFYQYTGNVNLHIKKIEYGRITTDMGVIVNVNTYMETYDYVDYSMVTIYRTKSMVYLHIPNKGKNNA